MAELPLVVVVVVTNDRGAAFEQTLESLAAQDYPNMRVVVFDTARARGVTGPGADAGAVTDAAEQVHRVMPDAEVHHVPRRTGYGAAANEVLKGGCTEAGRGAGFFVFCHDDVALEPSAVRALVETACLCDAAVVGPKLVDWDDPRWLLQMGETVDRTAAAIPLVERGEADQGQHDGLREVFAVSGAVTLVRASLFRRIGGFDEAITWLGDNLSLCWRVRLAGGRVVVTSATRARHREALAERVPRRTLRKLAVRHQLRILLTCTGRRQRWTAVPIFLALSLLRFLGALLTGSRGQAWAHVAAWPWNLLRRRSLWIARRQVKRFRRVDDRSLRQLQVPRSVRTTWARRKPSRNTLEAAPRGIVHRKPSWTGTSAAVALGLGAILLLGSRHLLTRGVPHIGQLVAFDSPGVLYDEWRTGWRRTGLGSEAPVPTLSAVVAGLGALAGGHMELLRTLLTAGLIPLGVVGAFRSVRSLWPSADGCSHSPRAALGAAVAYAALPLPYTALAAGRWDTLAAYAAIPWLLARLAAIDALGTDPETSQDDADPGHAVEPSNTGWPRHVLILGLMTAGLGLLVPAAPVLLLLLAAGLALGGLLAFEPSAMGRLLGAAVGAVVVSAVLHLPWTVAGVRAWGDLSWWGLQRQVATGSGVPAASKLTVGLDSDPALWALLAAAALGLLVGRGGRLSWAARGWTLAAGSYALVSARQRGVGGQALGELALPQTDLVLVLAGAGLALAVGCGVAAVEHDLAGRPRRFGLQGLAAALVAVALLGAAAPTAGRSLDGYWGMPRRDFDRLLRGVDADVGEVPSRVLWVGHPDVLPGDGWPLGPDLSYATTLRGHPTVAELLPGPASPATGQIAAALTDVRTGATARLGQVLAPMAVQYLAVPLQLAPVAASPQDQPPPSDLLDGLAGQLDLERVPVDPSIVLYRNLAFPPEGGELAVADFEGDLPGGTVLRQAVTGTGRWGLFVDDVRVQRTPSFGWANAFEVASPGWAELRYERSLRYEAMLLVQIAAWVGALVLLVWLRGRRGRVDDRTPVQPPSVATSDPHWIRLPQEDQEYVKLLVQDEDEPVTSGERVGV